MGEEWQHSAGLADDFYIQRRGAGTAAFKPYGEPVYFRIQLANRYVYGSRRVWRRLSWSREKTNPQDGAKAPAVLITALPDQARRLTLPDPSAVVDRILSFDTNRDDRLTRGELPERMEGLVSRGDKNQDGFLTSDEIVAVVDTRPTMVGPPFTMHGPGSLADVIADLKLPPVPHDQAMEIVNGHTVSSNINDPDSTKLYAALRELLDDEDYENFVAAAARLRNTRRGGVGGIVGGVVSTPAPPPR